MRNKTLKLISLALLLPAIASCVKVPPKKKPVEVTKFILVGVSLESQQSPAISFAEPPLR